MKWILVLLMLGGVILITFLDWRSQKKRRKELKEIIERIVKRSEKFNKQLKESKEVQNDKTNNS